MKCTQENWDEIKPILKKNSIEIINITSFSNDTYLVNNFSGDELVTNVAEYTKNRHGIKVYEEWDKDVFLEACGIKIKYTIEDLRNGKCALINDGTLEELSTVINAAFPEDSSSVEVWGSFKYYSKSFLSDDEGIWRCSNTITLPVQSVKDFIIEKEFTLPEKWCVKVTEENKDIIHRWKLDNTKCIFTTPGHYVEYDGKWGSTSDYTEITFEQFKSHVLKQKTNMTQQLTLGQLKDLYNQSSCSDWQSRIKSYISDNILARDYELINIKDEDIAYARKNATAAQLGMLKDAGIKFEAKCPYKDGDLLWVRGNDGKWVLRYSNGTLDDCGQAICYNFQIKSIGDTTSWGKHKLANIELPND